MGETVLLEDADVISCPHCESRLFVKNGKRKTTQNYKCKSCCKVFTAKRELLCTGCKNLKNLNCTGH